MPGPDQKYPSGSVGDLLSDETRQKLEAAAGTPPDDEGGPKDPLEGHEMPPARPRKKGGKDKPPKGSADEVEGPGKGKPKGKKERPKVGVTPPLPPPAPPTGPAGDTDKGPTPPAPPSPPVDQKKEARERAQADRERKSRAGRWVEVKNTHWKDLLSNIERVPENLRDALAELVELQKGFFLAKIERDGAEEQRGAAEEVTKSEKLLLGRQEEFKALPVPLEALMKRASYQGFQRALSESGGALREALAAEAQAVITSAYPRPGIPDALRAATTVAREKLFEKVKKTYTDSIEPWDNDSETESLHKKMWRLREEVMAAILNPLRKKLFKEADKFRGQINIQGNPQKPWGARVVLPDPLQSLLGKHSELQTRLLAWFDPTLSRDDVDSIVRDRALDLRNFAEQRQSSAVASEYKKGPFIGEREGEGVNAEHQFAGRPVSKSPQELQQTAQMLKQDPRLLRRALAVVEVGEPVTDEQLNQYQTDEQKLQRVASIIATNIGSGILNKLKIEITEEDRKEKERLEKEGQQEVGRNEVPMKATCVFDATDSRWYATIDGKRLMILGRAPKDWKEDQTYEADLLVTVAELKNGNKEVVKASFQKVAAQPKPPVAAGAAAAPDGEPKTGTGSPDTDAGVGPTTLIPPLPADDSWEKFRLKPIVPPAAPGTSRYPATPTKTTLPAFKIDRTKPAPPPPSPAAGGAGDTGPTPPPASYTLDQARQEVLANPAAVAAEATELAQIRQDNWEIYKPRYADVEADLAARGIAPFTPESRAAFEARDREIAVEQLAQRRLAEHEGRIPKPPAKAQPPKGVKFGKYSGRPIEELQDSTVFEIAKNLGKRALFAMLLEEAGSMTVSRQRVVELATDPRQIADFLETFLEKYHSTAGVRDALYKAIEKQHQKVNGDPAAIAAMQERYRKDIDEFISELDALEQKLAAGKEPQPKPEAELTAEEKIEALRPEIREDLKKDLLAKRAAGEGDYARMSDAHIETLADLSADLEVEKLKELAKSKKT